MVYSAIETTCFGLYWPSSGFYIIKEESIKAVKTVRGCWLRDLYQLCSVCKVLVMSSLPRLCTLNTVGIWSQNIVSNKS